MGYSKKTYDLWFELDIPRHGPISMGKKHDSQSKLDSGDSPFSRKPTYLQTN